MGERMLLQGLVRRGAVDFCNRPWALSCLPSVNEPWPRHSSRQSFTSNPPVKSRQSAVAPGANSPVRQHHGLSFRRTKTGPIWGSGAIDWHKTPANRLITVGLSEFNPHTLSLLPPPTDTLCQQFYTFI